MGVGVRDWRADEEGVEEYEGKDRSCDEGEEDGVVEHSRLRLAFDELMKLCAPFLL